MCFEATCKIYLSTVKILYIRVLHGSIYRCTTWTSFIHYCCIVCYVYVYHGCNIGESDSFTERTIHVPCTKSPTGTHLWGPNFRGEGDTFNAVTMQILCSLFEDFHQNIVNHKNWWRLLHLWRLCGHQYTVNQFYSRLHYFAIYSCKNGLRRQMFAIKPYPDPYML